MEVISVTHSLAAETLNLTCILSKRLNSFEQLSISFIRHFQGHHPINIWLFQFSSIFGTSLLHFCGPGQQSHEYIWQNLITIKLSLNCGCLNCVTFPAQLQKSTFDKPRILIWGNTKPLARQRSDWKMMTDTFDDISEATCSTYLWDNNNWKRQS